MTDRFTFGEYVRDALANLDDRGCLRSHPLGELLGGSSSATAGGSLRSLLLEAVEQIRPRANSSTSPRWRQYNYLVQRNVEGVSHKNIARELGVSLRQARRDHLEAVKTVASILWETYCAGSGTVKGGHAATADRC